MQVWIDGEVCPAEEATIGVFDRAVLFGESTGSMWRSRISSTRSRSPRDCSTCR
ncbi:MAG: hypothetical protein ACYTFH_07770 [Planctomycetota bacterium]